MCPSANDEKADPTERGLGPPCRHSLPVNSYQALMAWMLERHSLRLRSTMGLFPGGPLLQDGSCGRDQGWSPGVPESDNMG